MLIVGLNQHSCSTLGTVTTGMGDCLLTGKPVVISDNAKPKGRDL